MTNVQPPTRRIALSRPSWSATSEAPDSYHQAIFRREDRRYSCCNDDISARRTYLRDRKSVSRARRVMVQENSGSEKRKQTGLTCNKVIAFPARKLRDGQLGVYDWKTKGFDLCQGNHGIARSTSVRLT